MIDYAVYPGFQDKTVDRIILRGGKNHLLTAGLFCDVGNWKETQPDNKKNAIYTLAEDEKRDMPSAYQIYMTSVDEYEAAQKIVGSATHWRALCKCTWFMEALTLWRKDMALRDFSMAKRVIMNEARAGDSASARKLLDMSAKVIDPAPGKRVRQTKSESQSDSLVNALHKEVIGEQEE